MYFLHFFRNIYFILKFDLKVRQIRGNNCKGGGSKMIRIDWEVKKFQAVNFGNALPPPIASSSGRPCM